MKKRKETPRPWPIRVLLWIIGDPWRKIIALLLAFALYIQIDRDISGEQRLDLHISGVLGRVADVGGESRLRLVVPRDFVILEANAGTVEADVVNVLLSGPSRSLPKTRGVQQVAWSYTINLSGVDLRSGATDLNLDLVEVIRSAGSFRDLDIETNYASLRVRVGRIKDHPVRLRPELLGEPAVPAPTGFQWLREATRFKPTEVTLSGPVTYVSRLEELVAEHGSLFAPLDLSELRSNETRTLRFADWLDAYGLNVGNVLIEAELQVQDELVRITIPISAADVMIKDPPSNARVELQPEPATRSLQVDVPRVLAERLRLRTEDLEVLRRFIQSYLLYVDASELENLAESRLRVNLVFDENSTSVSAPELLSAYRRVRLGENALLWEAEKK